MNGENVQSDLVTQVANYLRVNVLTLFEMAYDFAELEEGSASEDYSRFISHRYVPAYLVNFCEAVIDSL